MPLRAAHEFKAPGFAGGLLLDGLQRTSSVLQFLDHSAINEPELVLSGCDILSALNGKTFAQLPLAVRLTVKRSPIRATIINKSGDAFVKYELFKRLNTGGSLLSAQEIRNCSSRMVDGGSLFYDSIQDMAKHPAFVTAISRLPESFKERRADEELVLRFFAVTTYRDHFRGNIEEWLDGLMESILFKQHVFDLHSERKHFENVFDLISEKIGDQAFTRFKNDGTSTGRLAPAYYEAVVCAFSENEDLIREMDADAVRVKLRQAFSSDAFLESTGPGANTISKLQSRIHAVSNVFKNA